MIDFKKEINDLQTKSLSELGNIENHFGNKYKGVKIKDIYLNNPNYFKWVKSLEESKNYIGNEYYFRVEYSKQAMILYDDLMDFYQGQGK